MSQLFFIHVQVCHHFPYPRRTVPCPLRSPWDSLKDSFLLTPLGSRNDSPRDFLCLHTWVPVSPPSPSPQGNGRDSTQGIPPHGPSFPIPAWQRCCMCHDPAMQCRAHAKIIRLQLTNRLPAATYADMYSS